MRRTVTSRRSWQSHYRSGSQSVTAVSLLRLEHLLQTLEVLIRHIPRHRVLQPQRIAINSPHPSTRTGAACSVRLGGWFLTAHHIDTPHLQCTARDTSLCSFLVAQSSSSKSKASTHASHGPGRVATTLYPGSKRGDQGHLRSLLQSSVSCMLLPEFSGDPFTKRNKPPVWNRRYLLVLVLSSFIVFAPSMPGRGVTNTRQPAAANEFCKTFR